MIREQLASRKREARILQPLTCGMVRGMVGPSVRRPGPASHPDRPPGLRSPDPPWRQCRWSKHGEDVRSGHSGEICDQPHGS